MRYRLVSHLAGSTTGLTNGAGTPVKTYAYDVFGAVRSTGIDQADTDFRFMREQEDADGARAVTAGSMRIPDRDGRSRR